MKKLSTLAAVALFLTSFGFAQGNNPSFPSNAAGRIMVSEYGKWSVHPLNAVAAGAATMTLDNCFVSVGTGNRKVFPVAINVPLTIIDGTNTENVTPTAVSAPTAASGVSAGPNPFNCSFTATFANAHNSGASGSGVTVVSNDGGLEEAINDAILLGSGAVTIDSTAGISAAQMAAALVYPTVQIEDLRTPQVSYWNPQMTASTFLAAPATLTAVTALPSATPVGAYGTGTYHLAIAYVDVAGQVGPESADFSEAGLATGSFIFSAPAASTGAVGYVIYISLTSGTYSLDYEVPLTSAVCRLTTLETVTPACAVTNASYGQTAATATVTAITVNTSPVGMLLGGVSGTLLTGNPNGRTTYSYVQSSHPYYGFPSINLAFTVGGIGSATPIAMGTVNIPAGLLNLVGRTLSSCGKFLNTDVNSSVQNVNIYLDAAGSDVAGSPVQIGGLAATGTGTAAAYEGSFCDIFTTSVSGAGATAGSVIPSFGTLQYALVSTGNVVGNGADTKAAAIASLNLAGGGGFENRISFVHTNTTGNATPQLQSLLLDLK